MYLNRHISEDINKCCHLALYLRLGCPDVAVRGTLIVVVVVGSPFTLGILFDVFIGFYIRVEGREPLRSNSKTVRTISAKAL